MTIREGSAEGDIYVCPHTRWMEHIFVIPDADSKTVHLENTSFQALSSNKPNDSNALSTKHLLWQQLLCQQSGGSRNCGKYQRLKFQVLGGSNLTITPLDAGVDQMVIGMTANRGWPHRAAMQGSGQTTCQAV